MTVAVELLQRHFETLVNDFQVWQGLLAPDIVWELPYAAGLGHPTRLSGRDAVVRHATWFGQSVTNFRFFDLTVHSLADPNRAVAEVDAEGIIKPTARTYRQRYVVFLKAESRQIVSLREYFDPVRAAQALDAPILNL